MRLPIGYSDFGKIFEKNLDFVDKSLFIKEIIEDNSEVLLITRPRRFGKTLNLSMLQHFFAAEVRGQTTKPLFSHLKIATDESSMQHQGKYPVIFLTFKDVKDDGFARAYEKLHELIISNFDAYPDLLNSSALSEHQKKLYQTILRGQATQAQLENALKFLTECLFKHYNKKIIVLIDEYDT